MKRREMDTQKGQQLDVRFGHTGIRCRFSRGSSGFRAVGGFRLFLPIEKVKAF